MILKKIARFEDTHPELKKEWHPTKNKAIEHLVLTKGSGQLIWWQCSLGHEWQATLNQRSQGTDCPYCKGRRIWIGFNDLATTHPQLIKEWHPTKNHPLTPQMVSKGGNQRVWWCCEQGHEWQAPIKQRTVKYGTHCPACHGRRNLKLIQGFNDLATTHPHLTKEWHPTKNESLTPSEVSFGMGRKVWWRCEQGHEWQARILSRHQGSGCPICRTRKKTG